MPHSVPTNCVRTGPDAEAAATAITPTALRGRLSLALLAALATSATALSAQQLRPLFGKVVDARPMCRGCESHDVGTVMLPYACKLLCQELEAMHIAMRIKTRPKRA